MLVRTCHILLDEALADFITNTKKRLGDTTIRQFLDWLSLMAENPDHNQADYDQTRHTERHRFLHSSMVDWAAKFVIDSGQVAYEANLMQFMKWSFDQTQISLVPIERTCPMCKNRLRPVHSSPNYFYCAACNRTVEIITSD